MLELRLLLDGLIEVFGEVVAASWNESRLIDMLDLDFVFLSLFYKRRLLFFVTSVDGHKLNQVRVVLDLVVGALQDDLALLEKDDDVNQMKEVYGVRDQDAGLVFQDARENIFEDLFLDVRVECGNRIVHEDDFFVSVDSSGKRNARFLATT